MYAAYLKSLELGAGVFHEIFFFKLISFGGAERLLAEDFDRLVDRATCWSQRCTNRVQEVVAPPAVLHQKWVFSTGKYSTTWAAIDSEIRTICY